MMKKIRRYYWFWAKCVWWNCVVPFYRFI